MFYQLTSLEMFLTFQVTYFSCRILVLITGGQPATGESWHCANLNDIIAAESTWEDLHDCGRALGVLCVHKLRFRIFISEALSSLVWNNAVGCSSCKYVQKNVKVDVYYGRCLILWKLHFLLEVIEYYRVLFLKSCSYIMEKPSLK